GTRYKGNDGRRCAIRSEGVPGIRRKRFTNHYAGVRADSTLRVEDIQHSRDDSSIAGEWLGQKMHTVRRGVHLRSCGRNAVDALGITRVSRHSHGPEIQLRPG